MVICLLTAVDPVCNDTDLQLTLGDDELSYTVEVCFSGVWGFVCADDGWDENGAIVACRQRGLTLSS